jgi:uncharacterized protein
MPHFFAGRIPPFYSPLFQRGERAATQLSPLRIRGDERGVSGLPSLHGRTIGGVCLVLLAALLLSGCSAQRIALMQTVRMDLSASQYQKAYQTYSQKVAKTERVDELLNLGLLAFESGDYNTSFRVLSDAERLAEERLTKSVSREAASLAVSDVVSAYQGTVFDKAMIHYYRSLGFLAQKNLESATVEGRAIAQYLEVNARESKRTYKDDAFLQWFSGSLYDAFGQTNDAWISYKRARELYQADYYSLREPSFMCPVTLAAVRKVGHSESETELKNECPAAAESLHSNWGRVIVLCEVGLAPSIHEDNIMLPIYKNDPHDFTDDDERDRFAHDVAMRRGHDYHEPSDVKLDYFLRVALPYYSADYVGSGVSQVVVKDTTGREIPAEPVQNIGAILRQDLSDREPVILVRAVTRALIKYAATKAAENIGDKKSETLGSILGAVMNVAGAVTEAADTRSWETLPDRIYAADFQLPLGTHSLRAVFQDNLGGALLRHDFAPVEVKSGEVVFLRARCMR